MIKIPDIGQIRAADQYTIANEPVSSANLMERAARLCFEWIRKNIPDTKQKFVVFAGSGNNGGDGLVIARMLHDSGYSVSISLIHLSDKLSPDCKLNFDKLQKNLKVNIVDKTVDIPTFSSDSIIIDALLGSGISRAPEGIVLNVIETINTSENTVIAIDLPSGLFADESSQNHSDKIVKADITLTIGAPKLALFMPENGIYCGKWTLIPIGLHEDFMQKLPVKYFYLQASDFYNSFPVRKTFSHKGTFGHALIMAGSKGKTGAAVLAAKACLRSGCGLTTVHCPADSLKIIQTAATEAMSTIDENLDYISMIPDLSPFSAIAFGPGCGQNKATATSLKLLIQESKAPLLIDADGLNILSTNKTWLAFLPENTILTPHPGEFKRLFGESKNDFNRLEKAIELAVKYKFIIVLKGAYTAIVSPIGQVFFNCSGNPGMAKGGSGDVLTGLIAGLLARGIPALNAALIGVYLHGLAGDIAAEILTQEAMNAGDLISSLPKAWAKIL